MFSSRLARSLCRPVFAARPAARPTVRRALPTVRRALPTVRRALPTVRRALHASAAAFAKPEDVFTPAEIQDFGAVFDSWDVDGSNAIDKHEFSLLLKRLNVFKSVTQAKKMISQGDLNNDGMLDKQEFLQVLCDIKTGDKPANEALARLILYELHQRDE